ncbi:MAG: hypothetical protein OXU20_18420 [Myxococcales bacterium]|nr:hypothetical protein [Myxococcales bacterium]MDD9967342.1 hypothetical protein [Myxococcales bacterium]
MEHLLWFFDAHIDATGLTPMLRAALVCAALYQVDLALVIGTWLTRHAGMTSGHPTMAPGERKSAMVVLPTLLRNPGELRGLMGAACSIAENRYPGELVVVLCIDGSGERPDLYQELKAWVAKQACPSNVRMVVDGLETRAGKAVAMEAGIARVKAMVADGELAAIPELFFNMDADSVLGPRALERMAYRLTRKRPFRNTPYMIVTSNVVVPAEQFRQGWKSLLRPRCWIALHVAREYLSSITYGKFNWKVFPVMDVSGALYCTWTGVHLVAPYYARFMQNLRYSDVARWWMGFGPPRFSEFRGKPLPEAMAGPGDDTWITWLACIATWKNGKLVFDAPATPAHALCRLIGDYFSRAVTYDPLAKVYSNTPTTFKGLFKQRLRWNSSRIQDLERWGKSHLLHWHVGLPLFLSFAVVFFCITGFAVGVFAPLLGLAVPPGTFPLAVIVGVGYSASRISSTIAALLVSDSPPVEWAKLLALPLAGPYHLTFNTWTLVIGYFRDLFGFGEPTNFAPEETLRAGGLTRVALGYRLRRAFLMGLRALRHGDVRFSASWFGWRETRWNPSGFDGWTSGKRPASVRVPSNTEGPDE